MRIAIACEDHRHFAVITRLIDAQLVAACDWLGGIVGHCRTWHGLDDSRPWYKFDRSDAYDLRPIAVGGIKIPRFGFIAGQPLQPEASMWRKVLLMFCHGNPRPDAVVLVRDMDGYDDRYRGMLQVRDGLPWPFPVIIAAAQPEIEAWEIAGFVARTENERLDLTELHLELGFDPTRDSHRLTSHPNQAPTDAKRVLARLCNDDTERRDECLADLGVLRSQGGANGLFAFLNEISQRLVPALVGPQRR